MQNLVNVNRLLSAFLLFALYKNLLFIIFPNTFVKLLVILPYIVLLVLSLRKTFLTIYFLKIINKLEFLSLITIIWIILAYLYALVFNNDHYLSFQNKTNSFRQLFILFTFIYIYSTLKYNYKLILKRVLLFAMPILLFSIVEFFLPESVIMKFNTIILTAKGQIVVSFFNSSYMFNDFNLKYIRVGSLFFEPLTLSIFASILYISLYNRNIFGIKLLSLLNVFLSIGKAGFVLIIMTYFFKYIKHNSLKIIAFIVIIFSILFFFVIQKFNHEELKIIFYTAGNHIYGLMSGLINGLDHPIIGNGLGYSGYENSAIFKKEGVYYETNTFIFNNNSIPGTGNESFLGIIVYQLGYIFLFLFLYINYYIMKKLYDKKEYLFVGTLFGLFILFAFSESIAAILLFSFIYFVIISHIKNCKEERIDEKNYCREK